MMALAFPVRSLLILTPLLLLPLPAQAERMLPPPGLVEELARPPEDPLPPEPEELPIAPLGPLVTAPDAHGLLTGTGCKDQYFTDCYRLWQPPPPPPKKTEAEQARGPSAPADPDSPMLPAKGGPLTAPPPTVSAAGVQADQDTYQALMKALKDTGLEGKILLPDPPKAADASAQPPDTTRNKPVQKP